MKTSENFKPWPLSIPFAFSSVVMALCVYKLIAGVPDNERALYWGGLSSVLAYWLPSPTRIADNETSSNNKPEIKVQESPNGLQIVQHPATTKAESNSQNLNSQLRYQSGDRPSW